MANFWFLDGFRQRKKPLTKGWKPYKSTVSLVGVTGLEPMASWSRTYPPKNTSYVKISKSVNTPCFLALLLYHKSTQRSRKKHAKNEKSVLFVCLKSGVETVDIQPFAAIYKAKNSRGCVLLPTSWLRKMRPWWKWEIKSCVFCLLRCSEKQKQHNEL